MTKKRIFAAAFVLPVMLSTNQSWAQSGTFNIEVCSLAQYRNHPKCNPPTRASTARERGQSSAGPRSSQPTPTRPARAKQQSAGGGTWECKTRDGRSAYGTAGMVDNPLFVRSTCKRVN